jgi:chemotaxis protein MotB
MTRRKKQEEPENHERWLVSYADFITLLFAFFVVMYSISSVNEGKYRVLSDAISAAFDPTQAGLPIQLNNPLRSPIIDRNVITRSPDPISVRHDYPDISGGMRVSQQDKENLRKIAARVKRRLLPLIDDDLINIKNNDFWIEIEIKSNILFPSGSALLSSGAKPVLRKIAKILSDFDNPIQVEGFTDNIPIDTDVFPSNWELSAARAASVVHLFSQTGVKPQRLSAIGYGEYKPIAANATPAGRRKNRRVNIVVLSDAIARKMSRTEQLQQSLIERRKTDSKKASPGAVTGMPISLLPPARTTSSSGSR